MSRRPFRAFEAPARGLGCGLLRCALLAVSCRGRTRRPINGALVVMLGFAALAAPADAQLRTVKAEVTPAIAEGQTIRAGATVRVTLQVKLPDGLHVQSHKPRDASLIPTVLTIEPPAGVHVEKIVYPTATDLAQAGQRQPLAVYGDRFTITAHLTLAADVTAGALTVPARLRYQACDEAMCYPPARVETRWTLSVD